MKNLVILTGAGISAESGIATFRDANGLWENHRIEDVASPRAFAKNPETVHRFYNLRRAQLKTVHPNAAHHALAKLEQDWAGQGSFLLITQNVDDLHDRAGSKNLLHMHGEIRKLLCAACGHTAWHADDLSPADICPACQEPGHLRPDIVWFGEIPYHMDVIQDALDQADIFAAIGTSGIVYPAAGFAEHASHNGRRCHTVELNLAPTGGPFTESIPGPAATTVPAWAANLLSRDPNPKDKS
jgi:NAD-dependent deacetylase